MFGRLRGEDRPISRTGHPAARGDGEVDATGYGRDAVPGAVALVEVQPGNAELMLVVPTSDGEAA